MRRITIGLEGVSTTARLLEEAAPNTAQRLWDRLPFEDRFTHSIWSGLMVHSNDHPKLDLDVSRYPVIENPVGWIAQGDLVVFPQNGALSLAYGPTTFKWLGSEWIVTKVAELEGDITAFAEAAYKMMFEGARTITITRDGAPRPRAEVSLAGRGKLVEIEFDGGTWVAELYEDEAPEYCQAIWDALPLQGPTTITHSSGETLHCWVQVPEPKSVAKVGPKIIPVEYRGTKVGVTSVAYDPRQLRGQQPGDLVWGSTWNGIRIVYGQGRFGAAGKLGHIVQGDLNAFAEKARGVLWDGSKVIKMRRHPG